MTDSKKIDNVIFKSLGEILEMFGNTEGYMMLYKSRRLTMFLHKKSINLFRILAKLLKKLLKYAESGEKLISIVSLLSSCLSSTLMMIQNNLQKTLIS
jgi:hypothetical protein